MEEHYNQSWVKLKRPWTRQGEPYNTKKRIYGDDTALRINTQPYPFNPPPFAKDFSLGYDPSSYDSLNDRWKYHDSHQQHQATLIGMTPTSSGSHILPPMTPKFGLGPLAPPLLVPLPPPPRMALASTPPSPRVPNYSRVTPYSSIPPSPSLPSMGFAASATSPSTPFTTPSSHLNTGSSNAEDLLSVGPSHASHSGSKKKRHVSSSVPPQALFTPSHKAGRFLEFKGLVNTSGESDTKFIKKKGFESAYKKFR